MTITWNRTKAAIATVALAAVAGSVAAATPEGQFPLGPVRIITGPSGAFGDIVTRKLARELQERWGQPVVVDNRARGMIGAAVAAKSAADGHTLLIGDRTWHAVAKSLYKELPYDPTRDFAEITLVASVPMLLLGHPSIPAADLREFIAYAKQLPQPLGYATAGIGTATHLPGEQLKQLTGIDLTAIHYKGGGAAMVAMLGGEAKAGFNVVTIALPHVSSGKVKAFVITTRQRFAAAPDIPTVSEAGYPQLQSDYWIGMFAPARTPAAVIAQVNRDVSDILRNPAVRASLLEQGAEAVPGQPQEFAAFIRAETEKWGEVIKAADIKPQ